MSFFDSNLFQTIVLIITVLVTLGIYYINKKTELRNAITILTLQIKDIEKNIEYVRAEWSLQGVLQESAMHYSTIIFDESQWKKCSHLIVGTVSKSTFEQIDDFFKVAQRIKEQQLFIKQKIQQAFDAKTMHYLNTAYTTLKEPGCATTPQAIFELYNSISAPSYIQIEFTRSLEKALRQYHKLTDGVAYSELKKLAKLED